MEGNGCPAEGGLLHEFLEELEYVGGQSDLPWCVGGDFNEVFFLMKGIGAAGNWGVWS